MTKGKLTKFLRDSLEGYSGVTVTNFDSRQILLPLFSFSFFFFFIYFLNELFSISFFFLFPLKSNPPFLADCTRSFSEIATAFMMPSCCVP